MQNNKKIKVVELFAGVGGFQLAMKNTYPQIFDVVFANQWEPGKSPSCQYAFKALCKNFPEQQNHFNNEDIAIAKHSIPENFDMLVGGFPCQDYSVATVKAKGIDGKKGSLWWDIEWILKNRKPKIVLLENVDRLLKSPTSLRGRDFAIILFDFYKAGYNVEWRVINAAEYGFAQRRRRVFIYATLKGKINYLPDTQFLNNSKVEIKNAVNSYIRKSVFNKYFPLKIKNQQIKTEDLKQYKDEIGIAGNFNSGKFLMTGFMKNGQVISFDYLPSENFYPQPIKKFLVNEVEEKYFLSNSQIEKIKYLKGAKKINRTRKSDGQKYTYSEGSMTTFDSINEPARTILTSEGSIGRSSHFIIDNDRVRKLIPLELERINGFNDNWTADVMPEKMRYFCMGNALVVPLVENILKSIVSITL